MKLFKKKKKRKFSGTIIQEDTKFVSYEYSSEC